MTLGGVLIQNQLRANLILTVSWINLASCFYAILEKATEADLDQHSGTNNDIKSIPNRAWKGDKYGEVKVGRNHREEELDQMLKY